MPKLKTMEELEVFATEVEEKNKGFEATIEVMQAAHEKADELIAELVSKNDQFEEKVKTLQTLIVSEHSLEKENTQEARDYKLGKMVAIMLRNGRKDGVNLPTDGADMIKLGAIPTMGPQNGDGAIQIAKGYEEYYRQMYGKAAITSTPLTSDDSDSQSYFGSYLVPVDTDSDVKRIAADTSAMMSLVTTRPVRGLTTYLPTTTDAFTFTKVTNQVTAKTEDTLTFSRATLSVETYAFWLAITEEMDEDSLTAVGALVRQMGGEAWGTKFDELSLSDSTYGAMSTTNINQVAMGSGDATFSDVSTAYLDSLIAALTTRAKRRGAKFFMHPTVWDVIANEKDADGNYKIRQFAEKEPLMARGYEVVLTDGMPALADTAVSTDVIAFGNPQYIQNGDKVGFEFRVFDQTQGTMEYDQVYLRCRTRQAFVLWAPTAWSKLTTAAS